MRTASRRTGLNPFEGCHPLLLLIPLLPAGAFLALLAGEGWPAPLLLSLLPVPLLVLLRRPLPAAALLALALGVWRGASSLPPPPDRVAPLLSVESCLRGTLSDARPEDDGWSAVADGAVLSLPGGGRPLPLGKVRVRVSGEEVPVRFPVLLRAMGRLRPLSLRGTPFGILPEAGALAGGYRYVFQSSADRTVLSPPEGNRSWEDLFREARGRTRSWILSAAGRGDGALYLLSLATGDVPPPGHPLCALLRRTGLAHLLAISGVNVAIFHILCSWLLRFIVWGLLGGGRWGGGAFDLRSTSTRLSLGASWGYVLLAGAPVPAVRSAATLTLAVVALGLGGSGAAGSCLALAAYGALAWNPFLLFSPSFLLSYGASWFLVASFAGKGEEVAPGEGWRARVRRYAGGAAEGAVAAFCGTLPVAVAHFGAVPTLSILWNLLFGPVLGTAGVAGAVMAVAGGVAGGEFLEPPVRWIAMALERAISFLRLLSGDGAGYLEVPPAGLCAMWFFTIAAAVGALLLRRAGRSAWPAPAAGALLFLGWIHLPYLALPPDRTEAVLLDVGKGSSAVVFLPGEKTVVVDCGSAKYGDWGRRSLVPFLRGRGVRRVNLLVLTHPHEDHFGGVASLAEALPVDRCWVAPGAVPSEYGTAVAGLPVRAAVEGDRFDSTGGSLIVRGTGGGGRGANGRGLLVELRCAGFSLWLPGDAEGGPSAWGVEEPGARTDATPRVLVLPHHGSRGADPEGWARKCSPVASVTQLADCFAGGNLVWFGQIFSLENGAFRVGYIGGAPSLGHLSPYGALRRAFLGLPGDSATKRRVDARAW